MGAGSITYTRDVATDNVVVGIARKVDSWSQVQFIVLKDSSSGIQLSLREESNGTATLWRGDSESGGTLLATSSAITAGFWVYYELKIFLHDTLGTYEFRVNESSMFSASNVDTKATSVSDIKYVQIKGIATNGGTPSNNRIDDFYIANFSNPTTPSKFCGNTKIEALLPSGAGDVTGWSAFSDTNYKNVDESAHNSDTDYNYSSTVNASDFYAMGNMSDPSGSIRALQLTYVARKDDALPRVTAPLINTGGSVYAGGNDSLTTSYAHYYETWNFNPNTSDYFTVSDINAIQAGIQVKI
jgi:hypothetical protein